MDEALLEDADGRHVGQRPRDVLAVLVQRVGAVEQVEGSDGLLAEPEGTACTELNPTLRASAANRGHFGVEAKSSIVTGTPDCTARHRGPPSLLCSWKSSSNRVVSLEDAISCRPPRWSTSMRPASATSSSSHARAHQVVQEIHDVEVVDQRVCQDHEALREAMHSGRGDSHDRAARRS